ncbi:MAG: hypothetical protein WBV74_14035 [Pseudonocardiaceae bacterium]
MSTGAVAEQLQVTPAVSVGEQRKTQFVANAVRVIQLSPAGAAVQVTGGPGYGSLRCCAWSGSPVCPDHNSTRQQTSFAGARSICVTSRRRCARSGTAHFDEEERVILPLSSAHISAEEWDAFGERALASIPRRYMPIVLGWVSSEATSQEWLPVRQMLPRLVRILAQVFWIPAYAKRRRRLYSQPVKEALGPGKSPTPR